MRFFVIFFMLLNFSYSNVAKADLLTGVLLGGLLFSEQTPEPVKDEFQIQTELIQRNLPYSASTGHSINDSYTAYVTEEDSQKYLIFFKNKGYKVSLKDNKLHFDLSLNQKLYLEHREKMKPYESIIKWWFIIFVSFAVLSSIIGGISSLFFKNKNEILKSVITKNNIKYLKELAERDSKKDTD